MSRALTAALVVALAGVRPAAADDASADAELEAHRTQQLGGALALAIGGRTTPGGVEVAGAYLYRLSATDWLASSVGFTFGSGGAACFRDRADDVLCDHGAVDGFAAEATARVRRYLDPQGGFVPFLHLGLGLRLVSYGDDELSGLAIPVLAGGGVRVRVGDDVYLLGSAELRLGLGRFGRGVGAEPQLSGVMGAGVEFALD